MPDRLVHFKGNPARVLAGRLALSLSKDGECSVPAHALRNMCRNQAEHDGQEARKFGGNAMTWWLASDVESITQGMAAEFRAECNRIYLDAFREACK
jgi:hypothetical protein